MTMPMPAAKQVLSAAAWVVTHAVPPVVAPGAFDTPEALEERLAGASQRQVVAGTFFLSTLQEIARLSSPDTADAARRLALGPARRTFEPFYRYPVADLLRLMDAGAQLVGKDYSAVLEAFGRAATRAFLDSPVGRTLLVLGGKDPHRLLFTLASGHHSPASFGSRTYERTGARSAVLRYTHELLGPSWIAGSIAQAFQSIFGTRPALNVVCSSTPGHFDLLVSW